MVDFIEAQEAEEAAQGGEGEGGKAKSMRGQLKDQKGKMELLPVVDHEAIAYDEFTKVRGRGRGHAHPTLTLSLTINLTLTPTKDFYSEPQSLKELSDDEVAARRRELNVRRNPNP